MADSFNHGASIQYPVGMLPHQVHMMNKKSDKNVVMYRDHIARPASQRRQAPASGCFGYTHAHLVEPRACEMEAEMFARFYVESDGGSSRLVTKLTSKPR